MGRKHILIHRFYRSNDWKVARMIKIASVGGICEECGRVGEEVHHKIKLTPENVTDVNISINQENLMLLCKDCHNKEHGRFEKVTQFDEEGNPLFTSQKNL